MPEPFRFAGFTLDPADRRLARDGAAVELNARYFDALTLLVREGGQLVTKERFLDEVWRGVPVTDEALTQCIRSLRRALGDDAAAPRFIATVPKHGYRFVAPLEGAAPSAEPVADQVPARWLREAATGATAAAMGGGGAGVLGGLLYGFAGLAQPLQNGTGAASLLTVLVSICALVGLVGGASVGVGVALSRRGILGAALGGALGGLAAGALGSLIGHDLFALLFGRSPGAITGPGEGVLLGGAVGLAAGWALTGSRPVGRAVALAAGLGGAAGIVIAALGGRLMAGSLVEVARRFPGSRLRFEDLGRLLGEDGFGPLIRAVSAGGEGALFAAGVIGAMAWSAKVRLARA